MKEDADNVGLGASEGHQTEIQGPAHNPAMMECEMHFIQIVLSNNKSERKALFALNNTQSLVWD